MPKLLSALLLTITTFNVYAMNNNDLFLNHFEYEVQNRAFALLSTDKARFETKNTEYHQFWSTYFELEKLNQLKLPK